MSAVTDYLMTVYPVASLSEAQLLSLADYYTEACLHPLIMTDESSFQSQAWHYEMADMDSPLTYNGVVYSEMLGGMTLWETSKDNAYRTTFPGASCGWHCFGDPDHIPELTWERVKAYHDRYYHPSNCTALLYGDFDDYAAFLKLLDEAFSPYGRVAFSYEEDNSAMVAALSPITVASLPEEYRRYAISDETDADGVRHIDVIADVDGVGTAYVLLDARALGQEDLHWLMLFARLVGELPTNAHTREEVLERVDRYLIGSKYSCVTTNDAISGDKSIITTLCC